LVGNSPLAWLDPFGLKIAWKKGKGCTDQDMKKAKKQLEEAKKRRNPDGTKGEGVEDIEDMDKRKDKTVTIEVGRDGNETDYDSFKDASDPKKGTDSTIRFDPTKKGKLGDGTERDPESSLVHEIHHAKRAADGKRQKTSKKREVDAGRVENQHRRNKGLPQRKRYGSWPLQQYPKK
jgi:hypothetical protein